MLLLVLVRFLDGNAGELSLPPSEHPCLVDHLFATRPIAFDRPLLFYVIDKFLVLIYSTVRRLELPLKVVPGGLQSLILLLEVGDLLFVFFFKFGDPLLILSPQISEALLVFILKADNLLLVFFSMFNDPLLLLVSEPIIFAFQLIDSFDVFGESLVMSISF